MAQQIRKLAATSREETGKGAARRLRRSGRIPAVVYGRGEETQSLSVDAHELERLFSDISIENTVIDLKVGRKKALKTLVREVQAHPFKPIILHVDFYQIHTGESITLDIPIRLVGTSTGVKEGGILDHHLHELHVECLPAAIPEAIEVDITELDLGDSVHVRDLALPEGVETDVDGDRTICSVVTPTVLQVAEELVEPELEEGLEEGVEPELVGEGEEAAETPATEQGGETAEEED